MSWHLLSIQPDLRQSIYSFLGHRDGLFLAQTNQQLFAQLSENSTFWKNLCLREGYQATEFSFRTKYRGERFISLNFGSVSAVIPLIIAASKGVTLLVDYVLVTRSLDANVKGDGDTAGYIQAGSTALHVSVRGGHLSTVCFLIAKSADLNALDQNGRTALMLAGCYGNLEISTLLVETGADVNLISHAGMSALHYAASVHCFEVVGLLLGRGATVDQRDQRGWTPLMVALGGGGPGSGVGENPKMRETLKRLLEAGADFQSPFCALTGRSAVEKARAQGYLEISSWMEGFTK